MSGGVPDSSVSSHRGNSCRNGTVEAGAIVGAFRNVGTDGCGCIFCGPLFGRTLWFGCLNRVLPVYGSVLCLMW